MKKERFRRFIGILVSIIVVLAFFLFPDLLDFPSRLFSIFQGDFMFGLF